jgi:hypothetical protein
VLPPQQQQPALPSFLPSYRYTCLWWSPKVKAGRVDARVSLGRRSDRRTKAPALAASRTRAKVEGGRAGREGGSEDQKMSRAACAAGREIWSMSHGWFGRLPAGMQTS